MYFNVYSAVIILLAMIGLALMWLTMSESKLIENMLGGSCDIMQRDKDTKEEVMTPRAAWLPFWLVFSLLVGQIIRAVISNGVALFLLTLLAVFVLWSLLAKPVMQKISPIAIEEFEGIFYVAAGLGVGVLCREWLGWIVSVVVIIVAVGAVLLFGSPVATKVNDKARDNSLEF